MIYWKWESSECSRCATNLCTLVTSTCRVGHTSLLGVLTSWANGSSFRFLVENGSGKTRGAVRELTHCDYGRKSWTRNRAVIRATARSEVRRVTYAANAQQDAAAQDG